MKPRMVHLLATGPDEKFISGVADGLRLVAEHVAHLQKSVEVLATAQRPRGVATVRAVADEESAKYLILLDAVRCSRRAQKTRHRQLTYCSDHVAKGIYAYITEMSPADFAEVRRLIARLRASHYLDGPMDVDWIFRNEILDRRERTLYVDFVSSDDCDEWVAPDLHDDRLFLYGDPSASVHLVGALTRAGVATEQGLDVVAQLWRDFVPEDDTHWQKVAERNMFTLRTLAEQDLCSDDLSDEDVKAIHQNWGFPLHHEDLRMEKVDLEELRERQRKWTPDDY
jgi:hypothetical protein